MSYLDGRLSLMEGTWMGGRKSGGREAWREGSLGG